MKLPDVPAVAGYVAVVQIGVLAPADCNNWPDDPAADIAIADAFE
jgi:hypothetical protein